jgi:hypothetical protein
MKTLSMLVLTAVCHLGVSGVTSAQTLDKPTVALEMLGNTLAITEIVATEACVQQRACYERNPLMPDGASREGTVGRAVIKGAGNAVSTWLILKLARRSPRWARVASVGKVALNGWLAARALDYHTDGRTLKGR